MFNFENRKIKMKNYGLLFIILGIFIFIPSTSAKEIYVPQNFTSIQEAINNATSGDMIILNGSLNVSQPIIVNVSNIVIKGINNSEVYGSGGSVGECQAYCLPNEACYHSGDVFRVLVDNVTIEDLTISNTNKDSNSLIWFPNVTNITLKNLYLKNSCNALEGQNAHIYNITFNVCDYNDCGGYQGGKLFRNLKNSTLTNIVDLTNLTKCYNEACPSPGALIQNIENSSLENFTSYWTGLLNSQNNNFTNLHSQLFVLKNQFNNKFMGGIANVIRIWRAQDYSWSEISIKTILPDILINNSLSNYWSISASFTINENNLVTLGLFFNRTLYNLLNTKTNTTKLILNNTNETHSLKLDDLVNGENSTLIISYEYLGTNNITLFINQNYSLSFNTTGILGIGVKTFSIPNSWLIANTTNYFTYFGNNTNITSTTLIPTSPIKMVWWDGSKWNSVSTVCDYNNNYCEANVTHLSIWVLSNGDPIYYYQPSQSQPQSQPQPSQSSSSSSSGGGGGYYIPIEKKNETINESLIVEKEYLDCSKINLPNGSICNSSGVWIPEQIKVVEKEKPVEVVVKEAYIPTWVYIILILLTIITGGSFLWLRLKLTKG
jgi:hypothetical protein